MSKTSGSVPNLINGISQQSPAMRLPSQAEASENYSPTITDGLIKRPRTDHLAVLDSLPAGTFTHFILRDEDEKYVCAILADGTIRVWDFAGAEKTVSNLGAAYLAGMTDPSEELRALTLIDHTFIVNKSRTVAVGTTFEPTRPNEALINVAAGNYGRTYRILINGVSAADVTTPTGGDETDSPFIDTTKIASDLFTGLNAVTSVTGTRGYAVHGLGGFNASPWALGRYNSTLYLRNTTTDFTLATEDGFNGRAMIDVKGKVQKFTDLPLHGPDGFVIEVSGDIATGFDNYWVKFVKASTVANVGVWKECVAPGVRMGFDAASMPHILVREADGSFTFKPADWEDRKCGDLELSPDPSFVGSTIQDVFFHKNRLGFLTQENICMSSSGQFFNFYRSTLTALLDTDPIDVAASHIKVSLLRHAVLFQKELLAFSDNTQFVVKGNDLLTPKTVNGDPLTELNASPVVRPEAAGTSIFFVSERDRWASLYEYFIDKALETADYEDVTGHAPSYVPAGVHRLIASPDLDLVLLATTGDPDALYAYKFFWNGQEKLQSAWQRWTFPNVDRIVDVAFDKAKVRVLAERGGVVHLESFTAEQSISDPGLPYTMYLDQSVTGLTGVYSAGPNTTAFTLPYTPPTGLKAVTLPGGSIPSGVELPYTVAGAVLTMDGNLSAQPIRFGVPYPSRHRLSPFFERSADGKSVSQNGRLQILTLSVVFSKAAYFAVEVTPLGRAKRTYTFNGRVISDTNNVTGVMVLTDGRFSVPILSRNDRVIIELVNDTWLPSGFTSAEWKGTWNPSTRQQ